MAPWSSLMSWAPFNLDAAGFLTLIGADEINEAVGRLVPSVYFEYMPLLAPFVIAGNQFTKKVAGYHLYDLQLGFHTTDLAGWLTRLVSSNDASLGPVQNYMRITLSKQPHRRSAQDLFAGLLSFFSMGFCIALAVLSDDWYGFASSAALVVSIVVRVYQVRQLKSSIDGMILEFRKKRGDALDLGLASPSRRCVLTTPEAKFVTVEIPRHFDMTILQRNPLPPHTANYGMARYCGWMAFAVHVISLNMASLALKLLVSLLLILPSVLYILKVGCDDSRFNLAMSQLLRGVRKKGPEEEQNNDHVQIHIGRHLKIELFEWPQAFLFSPSASNGFSIRGWTPDHRHLSEPNTSRKLQDLFAWLDLTEPEMRSFERWDLIPHSLSEHWWENYLTKKRLVHAFTNGVRDSSAFVPPAPSPHVNAARVETQEIRPQGRFLTAPATQTADSVGQGARPSGTWLSV